MKLRKICMYFHKRKSSIAIKQCKITTYAIIIVHFLIENTDTLNNMFIVMLENRTN